VVAGLEKSPHAVKVCCAHRAASNPMGGIGARLGKWSSRRRESRSALAKERPNCQSAAVDNPPHIGRRKMGRARTRYDFEGKSPVSTSMR